MTLRENHAINESASHILKRWMTNISETIYKEIASLHVWHSLKNRQYDNILFHKIIQNIWDLKHKNILEFWCWHGHYANFLLENWSENIYWVDIDEEAIKTANLNNKKWWKFVHLSKKWIERVTDFWIQFDEVYSMYVYETIKDKEVIENIFSDIFQVLKEWWKFQFIIWNPEGFYWKKCIEFEFLVNPAFPILKDGDPYTARLMTENWFFDVQDFYYSQDTIIDMLEKVWFKTISIQSDKLKWDEYSWMKDEKDFIPSVIFVVQK